MKTGPRRLILSAVATAMMFLASTPAFAQNTNQASKEDNGIGIGAEIMGTHNSVRGAEDSPIAGRAGTGFGLWIGGNKNGLIGFTGEFIYLLRNYGEKNSIFEVKTKALEIPAVFHVNIGARTKNGVAGYAVVGPVFTLILSQKDANGNDISDQFNGADIGIIGGGGIEVYRFGVEARGNWGLRSITSDGDVASSKAFAFEILGKFRFN